MRRAPQARARFPDHPTIASAEEDELVRRAEEGRDPFAPEVVLFVDESDESRQAHQVLTEAGEEFRTMPAEGPRIPAVVFGGVVAEKLTGIHDLLRALAALDATFASEQTRSSSIPSHPATGHR
jgi:hypothetical protein